MLIKFLVDALSICFLMPMPPNMGPEAMLVGQRLYTVHIETARVRAHTSGMGFWRNATLAESKEPMPITTMTPHDRGWA